MRRGVGNRLPNAADQAAEIARKERRGRALELRSHRATLSQIARELGVSTDTVKADLKLAFAELGAEDGERHRAVLNLQYDADTLRLSNLIAALMPLALGRPEDKERGTKAVPPDLEAARSLTYVLRTKTMIAQASARLNGANVPVAEKLDVSVRGAVGTFSLADALAVARENAAGTVVVDSPPALNGANGAATH